MRSRLQFSFGDAANHYYEGQRVWLTRPKWYVRLFNFVFRRNRGSFVVTEVDYKKGVVTINAQR